MRKSLLWVAAFCCALVLLFGGVFAGVSATMPPYPDHAGDVNYTEKMTGRYLVQQSAQQDDNLIIFGSSELRTTELSPTPPTSSRASGRAFRSIWWGGAPASRSPTPLRLRRRAMPCAAKRWC